jgi:hypothetical protein
VIIFVRLLLCALLAVGGLLVTRGTITRNKWGINLCAVHCPRCDALLPNLDERRSIRQLMWGGWTCRACGAEVDKWGREVVLGAARRG